VVAQARRARHPEKAPLRHSSEFLRELARSIPSLAGAAAEAERQATEEETEGPRPARRSQAMSFTAYSHPERE